LADHSLKPSVFIGFKFNIDRAYISHVASQFHWLDGVIEIGDMEVLNYTHYWETLFLWPMILPIASLGKLNSNIATAHSLMTDELTVSEGGRL